MRTRPKVFLGFLLKIESENIGGKLRKTGGKREAGQQKQQQADEGVGRAGGKRMEEEEEGAE